MNQGAPIKGLAASLEYYVEETDVTVGDEKKIQLVSLLAEFQSNPDDSAFALSVATQAHSITTRTHDTSKLKERVTEVNKKIEKIERKMKHEQNLVDSEIANLDNQLKTRRTDGIESVTETVHANTSNSRRNSDDEAPDSVGSRIRGAFSSIWS